MPKKSSTMTEREVRFALVYARTGNASKALLEAGYKNRGTVERNSAGACQLLRKAEVAALVASEQQRLRRRLEITAERVTIEMAALAFSNVTRCLTDEGAILNPKDWHPLTAIAVKSYWEKVLQVDGKTGTTVLERRIVMHDKWKALQRMAALAGLGGVEANTGGSDRKPAIRVVVRNPDGTVAEVPENRRE